jgi:hypothetical protein
MRGRGRERIWVMEKGREKKRMVLFLCYFWMQGRRNEWRKKRGLYSCCVVSHEEEKKKKKSSCKKEIYYHIIGN